MQSFASACKHVYRRNGNFKEVLKRWEEDIKIEDKNIKTILGTVLMAEIDDDLAELI